MHGNIGLGAPYMTVVLGGGVGLHTLQVRPLIDGVFHFILGNPFKQRRPNRRPRHICNPQFLKSLEPDAYVFNHAIKGNFIKFSIQRRAVRMAGAQQFI